MAIGYCTYRTQGDGLVNSLRFINADGRVAGEYVKNHPMIGEVESYGVPYGREAVPIDTSVGKIGGLICFDLNFDDITSAYKASKPDLLAFSSVFHGGFLQARLAFDCRAHLLTSVGGIESAVLDPLGRVIAVSSNYNNYVTCEVNTDCAVAHLDCNAPKLREAKRVLGRDITISDLDGVLVLVEPDRAFRAVNDSLDAGWNVMTEKPAGINSYQALSLARKAEKTGKICAVAMNRRHIPLVQAVFKRMRELTEITQVDGVFIKNNDIADAWNYADAYVCDIIHATDLVRYFAQSDVTEAATVIGRHNSPVNNAWSSVFRFENGITGTLRANYQTGGRVHTFEIHGPKASAFINLGFGGAACEAKILYFSGQKLYSLAASGVNEQHIEVLDGLEVAGGREYHQYYGYKSEDIDFIECIRTGKKPLCDIADAAKSMVMAEKLLTSAI